MSGKSNNLTRKQNRKKSIRLVVKANQLVEAKYMFDIWEMRLFLSIVSLISKHDDDDKTYKIWYSEVKKNFQLKSNQSYDLLREAAIRLFDKSLIVGYMKDGYERERKHHLIRSVDYLKDAFLLKEGERPANLKHQEYIEVKIDPEVRPYLLDIKKRFDASTDRYTSYELRNVIHLKAYGIRIYELLKQYEKIGWRIINIEDLKDAFNITNEYPRFSNFYKKVIKQSIEDINKKTDLTVPLTQIEKIKKGRKVHALRFVILSKNKSELVALRAEPLDNDSVALEITPAKANKPTATDVLFNLYEGVIVKEFGVTPLVFRKMLEANNYTNATIEQAIGVTRRAKYNQEITKSIAGFFIKALKDGFTDIKSVAQKKQALQKELKAVEKEYLTKRSDKIKDLLATQEGIKERTLDHLLTAPDQQLKTEIQQLGLSTATITLQDFREHKALRNFFVNGIVHLHQKDFADLDQLYKERILLLKQQLK